MIKKLCSLVVLLLAIQIITGCSSQNASKATSINTPVPSPSAVVPAKSFTAAVNEFSVVLIPDSQILSQSAPDKFIKMSDWIVENQKALNIQMVLHMGDVVNKGASDEAQYQKAKSALDIIDKANIPMLIAIGNHDYDKISTNRSAKMFNKYFGMERYSGKPWFGGAFEEGKSENIYARVEIFGKKYLFFALEFGPRDSVMAWVDSILVKYPDHEAIFTTHTYMHRNGGRTGPGDSGNPKSYSHIAPDGNDGEDMWQFLKKYKNVSAIYSGHHFNPNVSHQTDLGDNGNVVFQSLQDFQNLKSGDGRIRIVKFNIAEEKAELKVFNPLTGKYENEPGYEVTYSYKKPADPKQWKQIKFPEVELTDDPEEDEESAPDESGAIKITDLNKADEIVTVVNGTDKDIKMTGWKIVSAYTEVGDQTYYFPENYVLKAGTKVEVLSGPNAKDGEGKLVWNKENNWNNTKQDPAQLYNDKGEMVSEFVK